MVLYIHIVNGNDSSLGYVEGVSPLAYTAVKGNALKIGFDFDDVDVDVIERDVWKVLESLIDESGNVEWVLHIETDSEDDVAYITCENDSITTTCNVGFAGYTIALERSIRTFSMYLADYMSTKILARAAQSLASKYVPASGTGPSQTSSANSAQSSSSDEEVQKLIEAIENKTKASIVKPKETLDDYVCNDMLKEELKEVKDFFENRAAYAAAGVRIPKGILFKGVPGTGKTYAARCIAGSVDCYFMSCTASSLQGMYIGSGAENIKQVFDAAKTLYEHTKKGIILFIDEIDSFGSRESHSGSSSGEEDRTLNQLLAEMSGFEDADGIMVLAATNYPERIDDALMRSGRFSRQITIDVPEEVERLGLVKYYFAKINIPCDADCDEATVAAITEGMTPADIAEIANESGIMAIRHKASEIQLSMVNEAINKVITKNIRKPDKSAAFHTLIAVHEAGHVLAEYLFGNSYSIKVTNYSYGDAGGFTQPRHKSESILTEQQFKNEVMMLLGGRAAEEAIYGTVSTGASEDLARAKRRIKAFYENYHFDTYRAEDLNQCVLDTMQAWYIECLDTFNDNKALAALSELAKRIDKDRVLYTRDICNIIQMYY